VWINDNINIIINESNNINNGNEWNNEIINNINVKNINDNEKMK